MKVRATSIDRTHVFSHIGTIQYILRGELVLAFVIFSGSLCVITVSPQMLSSSSTLVATLIAACFALAAALLFVLDLFFSWFVSWGMYRMSQDARRHLDPSGHCDGLNRFQPSLAYAHVALVVMSMLTTSAFYVALGLLVAAKPGDNESRWAWYTFVSTTWLFDSVCNDFCMLVLGFAPILQTRPAAIESAVVAETIGTPTDFVSTVAVTDVPAIQCL